MLEASLVGLVVLTASLYAIWRLLPPRFRVRLTGRVSQWARRPGRPVWIARAAASMEATARARAAGCSACDAARPPPLTSTKRNQP